MHRAAESLGSALLASSRAQGVDAALGGATQAPAVLFGHVLRVLYGLLFVFAAEDRGVLHPASCPKSSRQRYDAVYSSRRLRALSASQDGDQGHELWDKQRIVFRALGSSQGSPELGLPPLGGLFAALSRDPLEPCPVRNCDWLCAVRALGVLGAPSLDFSTVAIETLGCAYASLLELRPIIGPDGGFSLQAAPGHARRATGSYYTPGPVVDALLRYALHPIVEQACTRPNPEEALLALRVCDPACGSGHFLIAAARMIAERLAAVRANGAQPSAQQRREALHQVVQRCIHGVDLNPMALHLCKLALWMELREPGVPLDSLAPNLRCGNALLGEGPGTHPRPGSPEDADRGWAALLLACTPHSIDETQVALLRDRHQPLHWHAAFPEVFAHPGDSARCDGFDLIIGNPPWIAHAGRAAQPLDPQVRSLFDRTSPAFAGYKTTHGLFVHRAATLLRPGGRLGLVIPTSVSDLEGYRAARQAHDALCEPAPQLPDFGDVFEGVFQPCMGLVSMRTGQGRTHGIPGDPWELGRSDLGRDDKALLSRLTALAPMPSWLFGERGLQTTPRLREAMRPSTGPIEPWTTPLRQGADIQEFRTCAPRLFADPSRIRLRPEPAWRSVSLLIRQTARWPVATASDGLAFRNSILAGFADDTWPVSVLLCLLNSTLLRWYHYMRFRDARQGMPQVKIGHLRALPGPPAISPSSWLALDRLGQQLMRANAGITTHERAQLDQCVCGIYGLDDRDRALLSCWWERVNRSPSGSARL